MSHRHPRRLARAVACLAAAVVLLGTGTAVAAPPSDTSGTAKGVQLTARWWQVALATGDLSFFEDSTTGGNCRQVDLPSGTVVMVAGTLDGASGHRVCHIPVGATVLLPVINAAFFLTDPRPMDTVGEARRTSSAFLAGASTWATVDGEAVPVVRRKGPVVTVDGTVFGLDTVRATTDGYWLLWEAEPGTHVVRTSGSTAEFSTSTSYTFHVGSDHDHDHDHDHEGHARP